MRDMNDDLIVTFVVRISVFISFWVSTTGFSNRKGISTEAICTGIFNDHEQIMDPDITPDKLPQPYNPLLKVWQNRGSLLMVIFYLLAN